VAHLNVKEKKLTENFEGVSKGPSKGEGKSHEEWGKVEMGKLTGIREKEEIYEAEGSDARGGDWGVGSGRGWIMNRKNGDPRS